MAAKLGPDPLPTTIARAHVREHRNLFCSDYDVCLGRAAHEDWTSWTCAHCARFATPPMAPRQPAALDPDGEDAMLAARRPAVRVVRRGRRAARSRAQHDGHLDHDVGARFVEEGSGTVHIRLEAACMAALFVKAGRAVAEVVRGGPVAAAAGWAEEISVVAPDWEHLLVAWMAELLVRSERSSARFTDLDIVHLSKNRIVAWIRGVRIGAVQLPKVGTYHDPRLEQRGEHVSATPVLDG